MSKKTVLQRIAAAEAELAKAKEELERLEDKRPKAKPGDVVHFRGPEYPLLVIDRKTFEKMYNFQYKKSETNFSFLKSNITTIDRYGNVGHNLTYHSLDSTIEYYQQEGV